ncbi:hypothetical protein DL96DRAFT_371053 [Flagelloscypha sp. PMI_526]|nr:hypothetical protein DL96DRAFT_371053 [Flagelloscypha sp. PMI_526]
MSSDPPLGHPARLRKSRGQSKKGCLTCKIRRVKCDEVRPACTACSRRREACVWNDNESALHVLPHMARAALRPSKDHQLSLPPLSNVGSQDLELLHNWTTNTIFTFVPALPAIQYGFQVSFPQIAFQNKFLLHALFAITSIHMHHLLPTSEYLPRAKMFCQHAILGLFNASADAISPDVLIMAEVLLATYWLAFPAWNSKRGDAFPDVFNWFPAAMTIMRRASFHRNDSERPRFITTVFSAHDMFSMATPFPEIFMKICDPHVCPFDTEELEDKRTLAVYEIALRSFIHCSWGIFMNPKIQTFAIYGFLCAAPDEFIRLFLEKRPRALILVAHHCAILGQFDGVWWYSWERCRYDLQRILSYLDEKWLPCMEYPLNLLAMKDQDLGNVLDVAVRSGSLVEEKSEAGSLKLEETFGHPP